MSWGQKMKIKQKKYLQSQLPSLLYLHLKMRRRKKKKKGTQHKIPGAKKILGSQS